DGHHHHNNGGGGGNPDANISNNPDPGHSSAPPHEEPPPPQRAPENPPQEADEHLPFMGYFEDQLNGQEIWLKRGWYKVKHDPFKAKGPGYILHGLGPDDTHVKGNIEIHGGNYVWNGLLVIGDLEVYGNNNTMQNVIVNRGKYKDHGKG